MKKTTFSILFLSVALAAGAQQTLQSGQYMFRAGDAIVKQQIEYKDPGEAGENVLWDFSNLKAFGEKYPLIYTAAGDSANAVAGTEHQTRYYYRLQNDSLLLFGYENPTTNMRYPLPELLLKFPAEYGSRAESYFTGEGTYCDKLAVKTYGSSASHADGYGTLILPDGDTLRNVTRVRTVKLLSETIFPTGGSSAESVTRMGVTERFTNDSIRTHLERDSAVLIVETHRWYAAGYRYPVFETVRTGSYRNQAKTAYFTTAFFYPPEEQTYLPEDEKNSTKRRELAAWEASQRGKSSDRNNRLDNDAAQQDSEILRDIEFRLYPNPVQTVLTFEFRIPIDAEISYGLYNIGGIQLYRKTARNYHAGKHSETIEMNRFPRGTYILQLQVNDKVFSEKVIKK